MYNFSLVQDMSEVLNLLKKQQAGEESSMTQLLRLKQDEEQEKLRKVSLSVMIKPVKNSHF